MQLENMTVKTAIKSVLRSMRYAKETQNYSKFSIGVEIVRGLWEHRHSNKRVSAVL